MSRALLEDLLVVAEAAGRVILDVYRGPFSVDFKGARDPVTVADRAANELICEALAERFPGVPIVAEESPPEHYAAFREHPQVFFVDPLDGTSDFVQRNGEFVVMIGLLDGARPTHGVVFAPATGLAWCGAPGVGAWEVAAGTWGPIRASDRAHLQAARIVTSRSHRGEDLERALARLGVGEAILLGSAGLKGAAVARGAAELYVSPGPAGKRWDACATEALVVAAGGCFTDLGGRALDYRADSLDNGGGLLATNAPLHAAVLARLAEL